MWSHASLSMAGRRALGLRGLGLRGRRHDDIRKGSPLPYTKELTEFLHIRKQRTDRALENVLIFLA